MFASPSEIAFSIGSVSIYYYGIIMSMSITLGILVAGLVTRKFYPELNSEIVYDIAPLVIIGAILGARIYYCILCLPYYIHNPLEIVQVWHGGLSIHGGILGGLIGGIIYAKKNKLPILKLCDIFSYGLILGQALGRWGNFFNSEAFGRPTENFFKLYIPISKRPIEYLNYSYFHPTFLYESILDICIFLILLFVVRRLVKKIALASAQQGTQCNVKSHKNENPSPKYKSGDGIIFFSYLFLYSIARIIVEQVRIDSVLNILGIPIAQIVSAFILLASGIMIFKLTKNKK